MSAAPLAEVAGFPFSVHASEGAQEHARRLGALVQDARAWFASTLAAPEVETYLLVLTPQDWSAHCPIPVFGVPYEDEGRGVVVGHGRAEFIADLIARASKGIDAPLREGLAKRFGSPPDATPYLDLVAVHELAHGVHIQGGWDLPRFWLYELWPQLAMVSYVASRRPEELPVLDALHDAAAQMDARLLPATELADMGTSFEHGAWLYAWYEFRLGALARTMWDLAGLRALQSFPTAFGPEDSDDDVLAAFRKIHPDLPEHLLAWPGSVGE